MPELDDALAIREAIRTLDVTIYSSMDEYPEAVYTTGELEALLTDELIGHVWDAPIRTRAKLAKQAVAAALGYPVPDALQKTRPRFPGQDLDVYVQQSNNLQVWNDELSPSRRYAVLRLNPKSVVTAVRVVEGYVLAEFDRTGTLTSKYQAKRRAGSSGSKQVSQYDTAPFIRELAPQDDLPRDVLARMSPVQQPVNGGVLSIEGLHARLTRLEGAVLPYAASERLRGEHLHRAVCATLGFANYADTGRFPDVLCQGLEVKLQLAPTIDLGLVTPASEDLAVTMSPRLRHCDARYVIAYGSRLQDTVVIDSVVTTTGLDFFGEFQQFGGLVQNRKLQLRLPAGFFGSEKLTDESVEI